MNKYDVAYQILEGLCNVFGENNHLLDPNVYIEYKNIGNNNVYSIKYNNSNNSDINRTIYHIYLYSVIRGYNSAGSCNNSDLDPSILFHSQNKKILSKEYMDKFNKLSVLNGFNKKLEHTKNGWELIFFKNYKYKIKYEINKIYSPIKKLFCGRDERLRNKILFVMAIIAIGIGILSIVI